MGRDDTTRLSSLPIHLRIRKRREDRGLSGVELAERAGVSPSYVSLIEKGVKIPDENVAVAIARALGDDEELYRSWARAKRYGADLESASADLLRAYRYSSDRGLRQRISRGDDIGDDLSLGSELPSARGRRAMAFARSLFVRESRASYDVPEAPADRDGIVEIPVVPAGSDPGSGPGVPDGLAVGSLRVDRALLDVPGLLSPFAFRATPRMAARVFDAIRPGDWVVVDRGGRSDDPEAVYAVRLGGSVVLSRAHLRPNALLLPPAPRRSDVEVIEFAEGEDASTYLVGRVVAVIRTRI